MPRSLSANAHSRSRPQRVRSQSGSQTLRRPRQRSPRAASAVGIGGVAGCSGHRNLHVSGHGALAEDLEAVAAELVEVKDALRCNGTFLGMSGTLLQEYLLELQKKDNLLRLAMSRAATNKIPLASTGSSTSYQPGRSASRHKCRTAATEFVAKTVSRSVNDTVAAGRRPAPPQVSRTPTGDADNETTSLPTSATHISNVQTSSLSASPAAPAPPASVKGGAAEAYLKEVDCSNLAAVLEFLETHRHDARAQRIGVHAVGRLARDEAQLRPLCIAAAGAVTNAITAFPPNAAEGAPLDGAGGVAGLHRVAVAVLGSLAYFPKVAALIAHEVLPALFSAMIAHAGDEKLQSLACEALARLAQSGEALVVKAIVQTLLGHSNIEALSVCCRALARLRESGICRPEQILDVLLPLTESQPADLELQQRAAMALQWLVQAGAITAILARKRAAALLNIQWVKILARFAGADDEGSRQTTRFHADVQAMFHEEVVKHFEYEAAERCLQLMQRRVPGKFRLQEVVRCLVENLEDYQGRLEARELAWDSSERCLVPLDDKLRSSLCLEALGNMEPSLMDALKAASTAEAAGGEELLACRTRQSSSECAALLDRKTEVTQAHQERSMELRREVILFEAVDHLELHPFAASTTQVRTALHMLETVEAIAPPEAVERLRVRLDRLARGRLQPVTPG